MLHHKPYPKFSLRMTSCRPNCIYCTACIILIFMIMLSSILLLIKINTSSVKFYVTEASLTHFNLTSNNTLCYNLKVNITVSNPNNNMIVYNRRITAIAWYKDNDFAWLSLTPFDQGHNNTTFLQAVFEGHSVIKLKPKQLGEYKEETSLGIYNQLGVDFDVTIRPMYGSLGSNRFNPPVVQCRRLNVPLISNGQAFLSGSPQVFFFEGRHVRDVKH
ncbi:NDR1/HIN1-like protein 10, partial [Mucuna pruriens]